jgi:tetratricopeptide (TPR) repeat protein
MSKATLDKQLQQELDDLMQAGYKLSRSRDAVGAVQIWTKLWEKAVETMESYKLAYVSELDESFHGLQSFYNWACDFEMELTNDGRKDPLYLQHKIDFCREFVARSENKFEHNIMEMKRAIGETYFELGNAAEGDALFREYLTESPDYGWGWIGWSDQYWVMAKENNKNSDRAIQILKQALKVEELEDRLDVLDRLADIYDELEMFKESDPIRDEIFEILKKRDAQRREAFPPIQKVVPVTSTKIGRNDPCPCGSGLKYKKCCG